MSKQAVIYARISTKQQSLSSQVDACLTYSKQKGFDFIRVIEETCSARKLKSQKLLLKFLKNSKDTTMIVYSLDRFSRNLSECEYLCNILKKNNITLMSVTDNIDLSTAYGQHQFRTRISTAQLESDLISERVKRTINFKKSLGIPLSIKKRYGYSEKLPNEKKVISFIMDVMNKNMFSHELTDKLYSLIKFHNLPEEYYVPIVFEENDVIQEEDVAFFIRPAIISGILNEYGITKRDKKWTPIKISSIYKECNSVVRNMRMLNINNNRCSKKIKK